MVAVLDRARVLTPEVAERLSAALQPSTEAIYSDGWNRWLRAIEPENVHAGNPHDNTIGVFTKHPKADTEVGFSRSPVGSGLSVVSSLVFNQARAASAARVDEDGEWMMEQPWKRAQSAMLYATMAFGAPHLFSAAEHVQLLTAYTHAFGDLGP